MRNLKIHPKFKEKLGAEGLTRMQNNELGQEVKHYHMHLIPRYKGDVENPRGGVRGVIPSKKNY